MYIALGIYLSSKPQPNCNHPCHSIFAVLHCAPPIPRGMHLFQWNGTGIRWNPVEWDWNPAEFQNSSGIHRNGPEFWRNPQEWTGIPAESARVDWNLRNLQEWTRICIIFLV